MLSLFSSRHLIYDSIYENSDKILHQRRDKNASLDNRERAKNELVELPSIFLKHLESK